MFGIVRRGVIIPSGRERVERLPTSRAGTVVHSQLRESVKVAFQAPHRHTTQESTTPSPLALEGIPGALQIPVQESSFLHRNESNRSDGFVL